MKKTFLKLFRLAFGIMLVAGTLTTISSCSKTNPNAAFLGTYAGNTTTVGTGLTVADTVIVSAGSSSSAVTLIEKKYGATVNGTVAGTTLTIPSQNISITGGTYPVSGSGALSGGNTLTVTLSEQFGGSNINYVFTGTK